jgi:hypothetical protein
MSSVRSCRQCKRENVKMKTPMRCVYCDLIFNLSQSKKDMLQKCSKCCSIYHKFSIDPSTNSKYKTCDVCRNKKCIHNRQPGHCKDCGGGNFCEHNREKANCLDCGGSMICEHKKRKRDCADCHGTSRCIPHNKLIQVCKICSPQNWCEHDQYRAKCVACKGTAICEHNVRKYTCIQCPDATGICREHGNKTERKYRCIECLGSGVCVEHLQRKDICKVCNFGGYLVHMQRIRLNKVLDGRNCSTINYLGCTADEFKIWIEDKMLKNPEMTRDNIHIDHIRPVSKFDLTDEVQLRQCMHYTNFQPLLALDNLKKHATWTEEDEKWWRESIISKHLI